MYNDGLLAKDTFAQSHEEYIAKIACGRVLALTDAYWEYKEAEDSLSNDGKYERIYGIYPVTINEDVKFPICRQAMFIPPFSFVLVMVANKFISSYISSTVSLVGIYTTGICAPLKKNCKRIATTLLTHTGCNYDIRLQCED